ncbi:hypothetical protein RRF57_003785 [Xylaria bambusicola]|uniref:Uncharacterized protein n=1 Tax=Xylaria bambusicola TaxID=326684 RepID=A0AAN7YWL0_9PEZI
MKGYAGAILQIDSFYDVDLSGVRPVRTNRPESRPRTTDRSGHVGNVGDNEATSVGLFGGEPNRGTACRWILCLVVHTKVDAVVGISSEAGRICSDSVNVLDKAQRRVRAIEKFEAVEKVGCIVRVLNGVSTLRLGDQRQQAAEADEAPCERHGSKSVTMLRMGKKGGQQWKVLSQNIVDRNSILAPGKKNILEKESRCGQDEASLPDLSRGSWQALKSECST